MPATISLSKNFNKIEATDVDELRLALAALGGSYEWADAVLAEAVRDYTPLSYSGSSGASAQKITQPDPIAVAQQNLVAGGVVPPQNAYTPAPSPVQPAYSQAPVPAPVTGQPQGGPRLCGHGLPAEWRTHKKDGSPLQYPRYFCTQPSRKDPSSGNWINCDVPNKYNP